MQFYYVYILMCSDGLTYTGITNDITRSFDEHQKGVRNTVGLLDQYWCFNPSEASTKND